MHSFLIHQRGDHVGAAVRDVQAGERTVAVFLDDDSTLEVDVVDAVPLGHTVAVADVAAGATLLKYGTSIGTTPQGFRTGHHVHTHDLRSARWQRPETGGPEVLGYRRPDGCVGIRNHVLMLPVDDISNAAVEGVAAVVDGTLALPHAYGRPQYGEDLAVHFRTLIGTGANPNVAAVVVVGIEEVWTRRVADGIAANGTPVAWHAIERHGDLETIRRAAWSARAFVQAASERRREPVGLGELRMSIKCGESHTTTGLASCPATAVAVDRLIDAGGTVAFGETTELTGGEHPDRRPHGDARAAGALPRLLRALREGGDADLLGSQPTEGNIGGGLSTIEEKALGNIQRTETKPVVGVLNLAEAPDGPGLWFTDSSSAAAEHITLMGAAGAVVHLFPTGQGNMIGNPIVPVIKSSGNPVTVETMGEHIDVDVTGLLSRELTLPAAGAQVVEMLRRTTNGR